MRRQMGEPWPWGQGVGQRVLVLVQVLHVVGEQHRHSVARVAQELLLLRHSWLRSGC